LHGTSRSPIRALLVNFRSLFTAPTYANFVVLVSAWVLCTGRHHISRVVQFVRVLLGARHHAAFYRFFSRARWACDALGSVLFVLCLARLSGRDVYLLVDDTLCRRGGPQVWGVGMHHDAVASNYSGHPVTLACGHNWVIVSVWLPLPWNPLVGIAVPVLTRLHRSKKRCPAEEYRKRTELAAEMVAVIAGWLPAGKRLVVVGDSEYSCRSVARRLPAGTVLVGRLCQDAALFAQPGPYEGRGRPRTRGGRLPSPAQLCKDDQGWEIHRLVLYGREVELLIKTRVCLWYQVTGTRPVRIVVTRDPKGRIEDRAYFSTDPDMDADEVLRAFARRWSEEVLHRNVKQSLGLAEPQNGWWRRRPGERRNKKRPGPEPHPSVGRRAVERTVPFVLTTYAILVLAYLGSARLDEGVTAAKLRRPWYRHKQEPSFADVLSAARRDILDDGIFDEPASGAGPATNRRALLELLLAA